MKPDRQALVILTPGFPSSPSDSTCLPMQQEFVRTFRETFPHLHLIILSFHYPYRTDRYEWQGNTVYSFNGRNRGGLQGAWRRRKIRLVLEEIRQQFVITGLLSFWYGECASVGKAFGVKYNIPHYCWLLGQDARKENKYPQMLKLEGRELIALSDFLQDEFDKHHGVRPLWVIPPGMYANLPRLSNVERDIDILGAGSLIPLKRYEIFLEVVHYLKKEFPELKAVLIGKGPEKEKLEILSARLDLESNLEFRGELPHAEVMDHMRRSRLLLHPSSYEGYPGVCQEALMCGAYVISFIKPMKEDIAQWIIVDSAGEMKKEALSLLRQSGLIHIPLTAASMRETVISMMQLFTGRQVS